MHGSSPLCGLLWSQSMQCWYIQTFNNCTCWHRLTCQVNWCSVTSTEETSGTRNNLKIKLLFILLRCQDHGCPMGPLELWWLPENNRAGSSNKDHWVVCGVSQAQLDLAWHHVSLMATYFGKLWCLSAPLMGNLKHREKKSLSQNHTQVWPQSLRVCAINYTVASKPPFSYPLLLLSLHTSEIWVIMPTKKNLIGGV